MLAETRLGRRRDNIWSARNVEIGGKETNMSNTFTTKDGKIVKIKIEPHNKETHDLLVNTVPRLTYDEILGGELERKIEGYTIKEIKEKTDDIQNLILNYAVFNAISKRP